MVLTGTITAENIITSGGKEYFFSPLDLLSQNASIGDEVSFELAGVKAVEVQVTKSKNENHLNKSKQQNLKAESISSDKTSQIKENKKSNSWFSFDMLKTDKQKEQEAYEAKKKAEEEAKKAAEEEARRKAAQKEAERKAEEELIAAAKRAEYESKHAKDNLARYSLDFGKNKKRNGNIKNQTGGSEKQNFESTSKTKIAKLFAQKKVQETDKKETLSTQNTQNLESNRNIAQNTSNNQNFAGAQNSGFSQDFKADTVKNTNEPKHEMSDVAKKFEEMHKKMQAKVTENEKSKYSAFSHNPNVASNEQINQTKPKFDANAYFAKARENSKKSYQSQNVPSSKTNGMNKQNIPLFEFAANSGKSSIETQIYAGKIRKAGILAYALPLIFFGIFGMLKIFAPQILNQIIIFILNLPYVDTITASPLYSGLSLIIIIGALVYFLHISPLLKAFYLAATASNRPTLFRNAKLYAWSLFLMILCLLFLIYPQIGTFIPLNADLFMKVALILISIFGICWLIFEILIYFTLFKISGVWLFLVAVFVHIAIAILSIFISISQIFSLAFYILFIIGFALFRKIK
ncbi:MFS transporter [Campylobacter hominis]|uniref:MFS transporter n=1 Tax=Campylobacter hominis TaxID=76517 RepID=UPI00248B13FB|nr:MFS transporter [Campylobacter hominis]